MNDPSPLIPGLDTACAERVGRYLDTLTKPPGSLGRLESLAVTLAAITGEDFPSVTPPGVVVFAADHGVAEEGVSAFPQAVTAQMVANFVTGGAAINVFARRIDARLEVVDVGVASDVSGPGIVHDKVRPGTRNMARENAMTQHEARTAIAVGRRAAERAAKAGCRCLIVGEMGIANTTASTAMLAALTGVPVAELVGPGTGVAGDALARKQAVIEAALVARAADPDDPMDVLARLGGLEVAAMVGAYLGAAASRLPILVDGFIATVAALTACRLEPSLRPYLIFGHRSHEPGHDRALAALDAAPLLDFSLRLGEGSGAALAFPLLEAATAMLSEMATFADAGVDNREAR
ncbi:nicotinate-nucleotide-dimethylbenzimidazole phosphoribosyltransferase [Onishia taeanensis]|uniref:Nicotinate-nucleotide--dimethylbenzimidazole phosphoribosyltransferase n=1 Tax=Onishia taeanensis TaxID=284577 RepID=A0A328XWM8_9GAMM|nr:nicotinate-nucleotide--dimethylbenzimidazole phosphoribosyltransferase [Halomonas taeanensis]RAR64667.1 nicotinate-nucleotide-dimethylbenzimidazole phosphoribosyltransferase [Halomonas taeanensis]